ncbi:hypothetical protein B0T16DRAFT_86057 [Cercophora newfieldiana]|uniref:Uncharacterized protein n=1 Tax=Cercophora newfieldiana TaxID=92897 RepID=A0AA39YFM1_9PEZI|nr:hypothetical protein B0T16DRAFT_86057 [Cercophora newfieldiana]
MPSHRVRPVFVLLLQTSLDTQRPKSWVVLTPISRDWRHLKSDLVVCEGAKHACYDQRKVRSSGIEVGYGGYVLRDAMWQPVVNVCRCLNC